MRSLAIGSNGPERELFDARRRKSIRLADEMVTFLESIDDPTLTVPLTLAAVTAKHETGEMGDVLRLSQRIIDLADDPRKGDWVFGLGSPVALALTMRGAARLCLGMAG